jgi:mono/diheme cytochrome c family protein
MKRQVFAWLVSVVGYTGLVVLFCQPSSAQQQYANGHLLVKTPLSGAAWVPPEQQSVPANEVAELRKEIAAMRQELQRLLKLLEDAAGPPDNGKATLSAPPQALLDALGTCTQCHSPGVAQKKGEGFALFTAEKGEDGNAINVLRDDLQARELRRIVREVESGTMPKGSKLKPDQRNALLAEMKSALARKEGNDR